MERTPTEYTGPPRIASEVIDLLRQRITESGLSARRFAVEVMHRDRRTIMRWLAGSTIPGAVQDWLREPRVAPWPSSDPIADLREAMQETGVCDVCGSDQDVGERGMMEHSIIERLGLEYRWITSPGGMGRVKEKILPREKWKQCENCGMSEGMIKRLGGACTGPARASEGRTMADVVDVVAAVRRRKDGAVWLARRNSDGAHAGLAGMWEYPGGKVERDEQLRDALVRELREEFPGVIATVGRVLDSVHSRYGETVYRVTFFEVAMSEPVTHPTHSEVRWMTPAEACAVDQLPSGTIFNARHLAVPLSAPDADRGRVLEAWTLVREAALQAIEDGMDRQEKRSLWYLDAMEQGDVNEFGDMMANLERLLGVVPEERLGWYKRIQLLEKGGK